MFKNKNLVFLSSMLAFSSVSYSNCVELTQSDFSQGTYLIDEGGTVDNPKCYRLMEDISFNPNRVGTLDYKGDILDAYNAGRPFITQYSNLGGKYDPAAFGIGFFAAIAISGDNIVLDLNGKTIEQSAEHALHQRFFAVIETADQPFVPRQGPSDFGGSLVAANNLLIKNGTIGRSSHHGIHGNNNTNIRIKDVDFVDFEVAAVALNNVEGLYINKSSAISRTDVPILGTFSNARFISAYIDFMVQSQMDTTLTVGGVELTATMIRDSLRNSINNVYEDVIVNASDTGGFIDGVNHYDDWRLYHNTSGVVDGNAYGYLVNARGVAVNGFPLRTDESSSNVTIKNTKILSLRADVKEVIGLDIGEGKAAIDPIGALFITQNLDPNGYPITISELGDSGIYLGNVLSNAQAIVAKAKLSGESFGFLDVTRLNISQDIIDWVESGSTLGELLADLGGDGYLCNGDTMFHVNKGVIGFKMDGVKNVKLLNTEINKIANLGLKGGEICGNYDKSHPAATLTGYGGAITRGYSFAGSEKVLLKRAKIKDISALEGSVYGVDVLTDTTNVRVINLNIKNMTAGIDFTSNGGPNQYPDSIGVLVGEQVTDVLKLKRIQVKNSTAYDENIDIRNLSQ